MVRCGTQINMAVTIVRDPMVLWKATVDPVKQDWSGGEKVKAGGRVAFVVAETVLGTKGAGRAASSSSAVAHVSEVSASAAPRMVAGANGALRDGTETTS